MRRGHVFARVTDRTDAYRAIASELHKGEIDSPSEAAVLPVLLNLIDASNIPLNRLMRFRQDERDHELRYRLLDVVRDHVAELKTHRSINHLKEIQDQFEKGMQRNLRDLRDALRWDRVRFVTSSATLVVATGAFAAAAALSHGPLQIGQALGAVTTAGLGVKQLSDFFGAGLDLSSRQREVMLKHPMAYMHLLSEYHP